MLVRGWTARLPNLLGLLPARGCASPCRGGVNARGQEALYVTPVFHSAALPDFDAHQAQAGSRKTLGQTVAERISHSLKKTPTGILSALESN